MKTPRYRYQPVHMTLLLTLLNQTSVNGSRVLLALFLLDLGASPFVVGLLASTYSILPMLLALQVGKLTDRIGARRPVILGSLAGGCGLLMAYFSPSVYTILGAGIFMGFGIVVFNVSLQNLVGLLSDAENRTRNYANFSLANSTASFIGPLVAGLSIDHLGHVTACLLFAVPTFLPALILLFLRKGLDAGASSKPRGKGHFLDLLATPGMRRAAATGAVQHTGDSLFTFYMPVYAHSVGQSATAIGVIMAMQELAAFVTRLLLPRLIARFREQRLLAYAFYLGAASLVFVPLFTSGVMLGLIAFSFGLGMGCTGPIVTMLMFSYAPPGRSGESIGLKVTVNHFVKTTAPMICGALAGIFGLAPVFWLNALLLGSGGALNHPRQPEAELEANQG